MFNNIYMILIRMNTKHRFDRRTNWTKEGLHLVYSIDGCNNSVYGGWSTIYLHVADENVNE